LGEGSLYPTPKDALAANIDKSIRIYLYVAQTVRFWDVLMAKWAGTGNYPYAIMLNSTNGNLMLSVSDGFVSVNVMSSKGNLNDGKWHHFAAVNAPDAHTLKLIVDNVETTGDTSALGATANTSELFLCKRGGEDSAYFCGQLDEVRIWSAVRTSAELRAAQILTVAARENGLVAYWRFDEQSGSSTPDISENDNNFEMNGNATLVSAEWPHGDVAPVITEINPPRDDVGDTITITGEHFGSSQGKSTVKFGDIDAGQATSWSDTSIQIKVPAVADAVVSVTVTVDGLQSKGVNFVLSGGGCGTSDTYQIKLPLTQGINIISLPLQPAVDYTAATLAEELASTIIIRSYEGDFHVYVPEGEFGLDFPIEAGKGYIVNLLKETQFSLTGRAWGTTFPAPSGGSNAAPTTDIWAFVVAGKLPVELRGAENLTVSIRNVNRNTRRERSLSRSEMGTGWKPSPTSHSEFCIALVDETRNAVVEVGDRLTIEIADASGHLVAEGQLKVGTKDLANAFALVNPRYNPIPEKPALLQNYPNPFNPETWIPFQLTESASVTISIYDISGKLIRMLVLGDRYAGMHITKDSAAHWNGRNDVGEGVSSGVYFYRINAGAFCAIKRMVILK